MQTKKTLFALAVAVTLTATNSYAIATSPALSSTTTPADIANWQVATSATGTGDGVFSSFPTSGFQSAVATTWRPDWIANNITGTNGAHVGYWTFFNFQQTFDLSGFNPTTAALSFQWAADDSGQGYAERGTWTPKYSLNGGSLVSGVWPDGSSYGLGPTTTISSGFRPGLNTINFYVEGNGVTDGFSLQNVSFTAAPVPEPETFAMMMAGLGVLVAVARRRKVA
jgi:hypothetical protein